MNLRTKLKVIEATQVERTFRAVTLNAKLERLVPAEELRRTLDDIQKQQRQGGSITAGDDHFIQDSSELFTERTPDSTHLHQSEAMQR